VSETQYPGTLYDYSAGCYCGVLVTEPVMRKLAALQARHLDDVKRVLADNASECFPSAWTLHYPGGVQTQVHYIDSKGSVERSIKHALISHPPTARFPVFIADSQATAKQLADERAALLLESGGSQP
jgi:hypothetical protein